MRPYQAEISLGSENPGFVEIAPHCSKTRVSTQGKQKETFLALKNRSGITEVGNKTSQSCTGFKKMANSSFSVVQIKYILYTLWSDLAVCSKG